MRITRKVAAWVTSWMMFSSVISVGRMKTVLSAGLNAAGASWPLACKFGSIRTLVRITSGRSSRALWRIRSLAPSTASRSSASSKRPSMIASRTAGLDSVREAVVYTIGTRSSSIADDSRLGATASASSKKLSMDSFSAFFAVLTCEVSYKALACAYELSALSARCCASSSSSLASSLVTLVLASRTSCSALVTAASASCRATRLAISSAVGPSPMRRLPSASMSRTCSSVMSRVNAANSFVRCSLAAASFAPAILFFLTYRLTAFAASCDSPAARSLVTPACMMALLPPRT